MKLRRKFVMAAVTAACLTTAVLRAQTPAAQGPTLEGYPAFGAPMIVKVIDTGAQPRKALRYSVPAGFKGAMDLNTEMAMTISMPGMNIPMNMLVKSGADIAVTGVSAGDMTYSFGFNKVTVDGGADANPMLAAAYPVVQEALLKLKGTATITPLGVVKNSKMDSGDAGQAQQMMGELTSMLENLVTVFPAEPLGAGAKWETRQAVKAAGQYSFQKKITEIVSIDGQVIKLKFTTEQIFPAQTITNAALPVEMQLDASKGSGSGSGEIRLDSLIPKGELTSTTSMSMSVQGQAMSSEITTKMTIAPTTVK